MPRVAERGLEEEKFLKLTKYIYWKQERKRKAHWGGLWCFFSVGVEKNKNEKSNWNSNENVVYDLYKHSCNNNFLKSSQCQMMAVPANMSAAQQR